jgi:hypothetical protein
VQDEIERQTGQPVGFDIEEEFRHYKDGYIRDLDREWVRE